MPGYLATPATMTERTVNTVHKINVLALRHLVVAVIQDLKTLPLESKELCSWS